MTLNELIAQLIQLQANHSQCEVIFYDDGNGEELELNSVQPEEDSNKVVIWLC